MLARVRTPADLPQAVAMESTGWGLSADITAAIAKQLEILFTSRKLAPFFREGLKMYMPNPPCSMHRAMPFDRTA